MISKYTRLIWIVFLSILILPAITTAQTLTNKERRNMNLKLLNAIETYESASTLRGVNASYDFIGLFENENSRIYCDLLDYTSDDNRIKVSEYVKLLSEKQYVETSIKEVRKTSPIYMEDGWHTNVVFQKRLNYIDNNGVWFSSDEYYGSDYDIVVEFVYKPQEQTCYIADISGSMPSEKEHLPNKFVVVQDSPERTKPIYFTQKDLAGTKSIDSLNFNSFHQAYINNTDGLVAWSDNVHIKDSLIAQNANYDLIKLRYKNARFRAKPYFAIAPFGMYNCEFLTENINESKNSAWELGVDLGVTFSLGRGSQMGIFAGAGYQQSSITLDLKDGIPEYTIKNSYSPPTGDNYNDKFEGDLLERKYLIESAHEKIVYKNLVVPVYIEFEHNLGKGIYFVWNLGAKFYKPKGSSTYMVSYKVTDALDGIPYTLKDQEMSDVLYPSTYSEGDFLSNLSIIGSAGIDVNLYQKHIFLSVKGSYEWSPREMHIADGEYFTPIIYSPQERVDVATRSLLGSTTFRRQAIWIKGGLTFKF